jgi:hypothetical protein
MFEGEFHGGDFLFGAVGEVGDVASFDLGALATRVAEVDGLVDLAVRGGPRGAGDVPAYIIEGQAATIKRKQHTNRNNACLHNSARSLPQPIASLRFTSKSQEWPGVNIR